MTEGDLFVYYRKGKTLMSFVDRTKDNNNFLILASSEDYDKEFTGQILPWNDKLMNKVIKVNKLNYFEKWEIFKMIFGEKQ